MSLLGALGSAVSALNAQSQAIAMVADNLANSGTYGYKTTTASFQSMLSGSGGSQYSSGGVTVSALQNITQQGLLTATSVSTNIAIQGNGFFPVSTGVDGGSTLYTRNGEFSIDSSGYLVNNGYYLLGWRTDASGDVVGGSSSGSLEAINTNILSSSASPTTSAAIKANLPADAEIGDTFTSEMEVYESLGTAHDVTITWEKTADNTWSADLSDPSLASGAGASSGTSSGGPLTISFNGDGTLASVSPSPATLSISGWSTGAATSSIALDLGTVGSATGLSQYSSDADEPTVDVDSIVTDGMAYGKLTGVSVDSSGAVMASFDNGQTISIYKIPVATFTNPNGLSAQSGGVYAATSESGSSALHQAGEGGAGTVSGGMLEASTTDTNEEFSSMIAAQQAYSAAAQVITTVGKMYDTLISAVR